MTIIEYRGYSICQKAEFGQLRLLKWEENGDFIVTKNNVDMMQGTKFQSIDDAKQAIDILEKILKRLRQA